MCVCVCVSSRRAVESLERSQRSEVSAAGTMEKTRREDAGKKKSIVRQDAVYAVLRAQCPRLKVEEIGVPGRGLVVMAPRL